MLAFFDTNILVYSLGSDAKARTAQALLAEGGVIGVQSLNELSNVALRKLGYDWATLNAVLNAMRVLCPRIVPLTEDIHREGVRLAQRYQFSIWDSMIAAAAICAGCDRLWSEDLHHGLMIDGRLEVANPFL